MISVKCPNCGEFVAIDEKVETEKICPHCDNLIKLTRENAEYAEILGQSDKLKEKCDKALEEYKNSSEEDAAKSITPLLGAYSDYKTLPNFFKIWRDFILGVAAQAVSKKDTELQTLIKNHAKRFDEEMKGEDSLYLFLLMSNAKIGNNTDWDILIEQTCGDSVKFSSLVHSIKDYVAETRNKAFAIYVFNLLAAKEEQWAKEVKYYLSTVLDDDKIAEDVFPRRAFGGKTKKFIRKASTYCKKYCPEYIVEETKVWANYVAACKMQKRRNLGIVIGALAVVAGAAIGVTCYLNAIDKDTVAFNIEKVITHTYGEALDTYLSDYTVTYKKNSGAKVEKPITIKMLSGYNAEVVGSQQTVFVEYAGKSTGITVIITPAQLATPVLSLSGNYVTWEFVANAANYDVYINSETVSTTTVEGLSYDLSANEIFGPLDISVRANADGSGKYSNSEKSQNVSVTKLQAPQKVSYEDGFLKWDAVEGATKYELTVNGNAYTTENNYYEIGFAQGDNEVKVIATTTASSLISGVTEKTIYYYKHQPATAVTYTADKVYWEAEAEATTFDIYVNHTLWKEFSRRYFDVQADGFAEAFGSGVHVIDIVSKSSRTGTEPSEKSEFTVAVGNHITLTENNRLSWDAVEAGSSGAVTYSVLVNGNETLNLNNSYFTFPEVDWQDGENTVTVTAKYGGTTVVCETVKVTKLVKPQVSVSGGKWQTDGNADNRYRKDDDDWLTELPALDEIDPGEHIVTAKRVKSSEDAFEIESATVEIKLYRPAAPSISVNYGEISCNYDKTKYDIKLYRADMAHGDYSEISSLSDIHMAGTHYIKAVLVGKEGANTEYDYVIPSSRSEYITVEKLEAPVLTYNKDDLMVTANVISNRLKFYYMLNGVETELKDGDIKYLPKGAFSIYARLEASSADELTSDNSHSVSVFNMDITVSISETGDAGLMYVRFGGCAEIDSITYTYEIKLYNSENVCIGNRTVDTPITINKNTAISSENIVTQANYGAALDRNHYVLKDAKRVELIVNIVNGSQTQQLTATMNR